MAVIQLIVNDEELDLYENINIPLTFQTQSINNITEARGNFSRSFDIPRTDKNNRLLETSFAFTNYGTLPYRKIDAQLKINGQELPKGFVIVEDNGLNEKQIKLTYYSGNSNFFQIINKTQLRDCDFSSASHLWNDDFIPQSFTNQKYVYSFIDYSGDELNRYFTNIPNAWSSTTTFYLNDYVKYGSNFYRCKILQTLNQIPTSNPNTWEVVTPMQKRIRMSRLVAGLFANTYKEAIEKHTGYKLEGKLFTLPIWNKLLFPFSLSKLQRRKQDAAARINKNYYANLNSQIIAANQSKPLKFLEHTTTEPFRPTSAYTYSGYDSHWGINLNDDAFYQAMYFPDCTKSRVKFVGRFKTTSGTANIIFEFDNPGTRVFNSNYTLKLINESNGVPFGTWLVGLDDGGSNYVTNFRMLNVPPDITWRVEIECDFMTGPELYFRILFRTNWSSEWYETFTETRYVEHIEHEDLIKNHYLYWGPFLGYFTGQTYSGQNVTVYSNTNDRFLWTQPNVRGKGISAVAGDYWQLLGGGGAGTTPSTFNKRPFIDRSEDDYLTIKYGGDTTLLSIQDNLFHPQYSWITGNELVPNITVATWIKNIANMFGCLIKVNEDTRTVYFKMWSEIYDDLPKAYEWKDKLVNVKKATWTTRSESIGQKNIVKYSNDKTLPVEYGQSVFYVEDETINTEATVYNLIFSATDTKLKFSESKSIPLIKRIEDKYTGYLRYWYNITGTFIESPYFNPSFTGEDGQRVLLFDPVAYDSDTNKIILETRDAGEYLVDSNLPYCYFNDATKTEQLGFDTYLFQTFHRWLNYIYTKHRILNCEIILNSNDLVQLDLLNPVYIEYYQSYFLILKIQDWIAGRPCKVQLLKLQ